MMTLKFMLCLSLLLPILMNSARAEQTGDSINYNFQGKFMITSPCTVSDDKIMNIPFGNIGVKKIDGINFSQQIPYTVDCHGVADDTPLNVKIVGTAVYFDGSAVKTSVDGLGIQIQANNEPMALNQSLKTTLGAISSLVLTAIPVKDPDTELTAQSFIATATLAVEYE
jgi:type 1 fimbria pilin